MMLQSMLSKLALLLALLVAQGTWAAADRVLLVVSNQGRADATPSAGFDFDEFAQAYWIFHDHGFQIDVASPDGGEAVPGRHDAAASYNARLLAAPEVMAKLKATLRPAEVKVADYAVVFVVGGKGAMFDLAGNEALQRLIARHYQRGGVVATVCHGAAALVDVKLDDGRYLVAGRAVNSFTRAEEMTFSPDWAKRYPFMLEDRLRERGARFEAAPPMLIHVARDERLITGQNPFATGQTVEAVLRALGREPKPRQISAEESTIQLLARLLDPARRAEAEREFTRRADPQQAKLIAMYGSQRSKAATDPAEVELGLRLIELAAPHFSHPRLALAHAHALQKLGRAGEARKVLEAAAGRDPEAKEIKQALAALPAPQ